MTNRAVYKSVCPSMNIVCADTTKKDGKKNGSSRTSIWSFFEASSSPHHLPPSGTTAIVTVEYHVYQCPGARRSDRVHQICERRNGTSGTGRNLKGDQGPGSRPAWGTHRIRTRHALGNTFCTPITRASARRRTRATAFSSMLMTNGLVRD